MKVGDLVKFKIHPGMYLPEIYYLVIDVKQKTLIFLDGWPTNQAFATEQLEVVSESR